ncbi:hypothetical protein C8F01DRAFT_1374236 [Mycena amicta]|nr:hypothetical protein C8F01DRAFT_1374236 [Mycena amicta]
MKIELTAVDVVNNDELKCWTVTGDGRGGVMDGDGDGRCLKWLKGPNGDPQLAGKGYGCTIGANFYNLRHLQVMQATYDSVPATLLYLLPHLHRSPARKTIDTLTIEPVIWDYMDPHPAPDLWRALDNTLAAPEDWPVLRCIKFRGPAYRRLGQDPIADEFSAALHRNLPECARRGLLEVDLWDHDEEEPEL